jgi:predicted dehydrogenase
VAVVGIHGHGWTHLRNAQALQATGSCQLVAVADPRPPDAGSIDAEVRVFDSLQTLLAAAEVDVVVICTPIHTHRELAEAAMRAGADVLLEKPPVPTMAEFQRLQRVRRETGRICQIGFQSLGSQAVAVLAEAVAMGRLGSVTTISARCAWVRSVAYFTRSRWAGHRELDGVPVMDGVLTNPFAHAVATALRLDGSTSIEDVLTVETDLFRANDIHSDDTSTVRVTTRRGTTLLFAATLCSPVVDEPVVTVAGTLATATLRYADDEISVEYRSAAARSDTDVAGSYGRDDLLANLLEHRGNPALDLMADIDATGAFTAVLEALRLAPAPAAIPPSCITWQRDEFGRHAVVTGVREWIRLAAESGRTFTELGAPWTSWARNERAASNGELPDRRLRIGGTAVATLDLGWRTAPTSSPHPFLHPVRTLGGFQVTDAYPADHDWHVGIGIAVPDVEGWNLWGGPTYVRGSGYRWLDDHGRIEHIGWTDRGSGSASEQLRWLDGHEHELLLERRELRWRAPKVELRNGATAWILDLAFTLSVPPAGESDTVLLGSPGSNGRPGGGYGGFFWRLPRTDGIQFGTPTGVGADDVHGTVADWLWVALRTGEEHATLLVLPTDEVTAADRWFVRDTGYPGLGSSLAFDNPVEVTRERPLHRGFRAVIADGRVDPADLLAIGLGPSGAG